MGLNKITISRQDGGLNRPFQSSDGVSGLLYIASAFTGTIAQAKITDPTQLDAEFGIPSSATTEAEGAVLKYHVEEYFRFSDSPIYIQTALASTDYSEITSLKNFSRGDIKLFGVINADEDIDSATIQLIQGEAESIEAEYAPTSFLYSAPITGNVDAQPDVKGETAKNVSVLLGQDLSEGSEGKRLFDAGYHTGSLGTCLGINSKNPVHMSQAYVAAGDLRGGGGYTDPGFIDGAKVSETTLTAMNAIVDNGYVILRDYVGLDTITFTKGLTAEADTSDFSLLQNNRVYNKSSRVIYASLAPQLDAPLYVDNSGKLQPGTVAFFKNLAGSGLQVMQNAGEISAFSVSIDATQDVLSTSKLEIVAKIIPVGSASEIEVKLGFSTSL